MIFRVFDIKFTSFELFDVVMRDAAKMQVLQCFFNSSFCVFSSFSLIESSTPDTCLHFQLGNIVGKIESVALVGISKLGVARILAVK